VSWRSLRLVMAFVLAGMLGACAGVPGKAPIAERGIDIDGECSQRDVDGFQEQARLKVRDNQVEALSWRIVVGRRGECRFELPAFRQVRSRPHIELAARDGGSCRLMVWRDERRITLAHAHCAANCQPRGIDDEAWPAMFDPRTGGCARTS
jgi:hypothetical protein